MKRERIVILDGYNVIHRVPELKRRLQTGLAEARVSLLRYCGRWMSKRRDVSRIYVVFDGDSSVASMDCGTARGVHAVFTRTGEEADDRIIDMVGRGRQSTEYIVVSDDSYVSLTSRRFMASAMPVSEFYAAPASRQPNRMPEPAEEAKKDLTLGEEEEITEELRRKWGGY